MGKSQQLLGARYFFIYKIKVWLDVPNSLLKCEFLVAEDFYVSKASDT